jgi:hypothetical protein
MDSFRIKYFSYYLGFALVFLVQFVFFKNFFQKKNMKVVGLVSGGKVRSGALLFSVLYYCRVFP